MDTSIQTEQTEMETENIHIESLWFCSGWEEDAGGGMKTGPQLHAVF